MSDLFVDPWGSGVPVVLVHGSLAIGADEWQAQRALAEEGFRLCLITITSVPTFPVVVMCVLITLG